MSVPDAERLLQAAGFHRRPQAAPLPGDRWSTVWVRLLGKIGVRVLLGRGGDARADFGIASTDPDGQPTMVWRPWRGATATPLGAARAVVEFVALLDDRAPRA